MASQVAVAEVAVVPVFKGFRKSVSNEAEGAAQTGEKGFRRVFSKTGDTSGKQVGTGFKKAFDQSSKGTGDRAVKALEGNVAKATRALSAARLKEQDSIGKVRVAQSQLNEANKKYAQDSSQVIRAQERLASESRKLEQAHEGTERATDDLKRAQSELARAADHAGDELSDAGQKGVTGFRSNVVSGVKSFAGPLITAFAALGIGSIVMNAFQDAKEFIAGSIDLASDLEQSVGGVTAIFGDQAKQIQDWAAAADQAVGLSQSGYNEFATIVGAQLKNLGTPLEEIGDQTNWLIELGADLSAQYGGPTSEAVSALSSLLRGERDPIERYGVSITEAAVKAEALALGLADVTQDADKVAAAQLRAELAQRSYNDAVAKYGENSDQALSANASLITANSALEKSLEGSTGELTAQQKAQATLSLLTKQTADAQGAFARESDTLAGQQQRNAAAWENIQTQLGTALLPVAQEVASVIGEDLLPAIAELAEEHGPELADAFVELLPSLTDLAEDVLPLLPDAIEAVINAMPAFIGFLNAVTPVLSFLTQATGDQNSAFSSLSSLISGDMSFDEFADKLLNMEGPFGDVTRWGTGLVEDVSTWFSEIPANVGQGVDDAIAWLTGLPERALEALGDLGSTLVQSGKDLMGGFIKGIQESPVGDAISGALDWLGGFFPHSPAKRGPFSGSGWTDLKKSGEATWEQYVKGMGKTAPEFPTFGAAGADVGGTSTVTARAPGVPAAGVSQVNHFDKTDPREAAELANQMLAATLRGA